MKNLFLKLIIMATLMMLAFPLAGCKTTTASRAKGKATLHTSVIYRERIILPRKATVTVTLEDVSKMDVAAEIIAQSTILTEGTPPYSIDLIYDASKLEEKARYAVRARIEENGRLLFINDTHIDPFARPAGETIEILVKSVAR